MQKIQKILVAYDFSEKSEEALRMGIYLAQKYNAFFLNLSQFSSI